MIARNLPRRKEPKRNKYFLALLPVIFLGLFFVYRSRTDFLKNNMSLNESLTFGLIKTKETVKGADKIDLNSSIYSVIAANPNIETSVTMIDLGSGQKYQFGGQDSFFAASTNKIYTALCYLHEVEKGNRTLKEYLGDYPASWHLKQIINQSNNDSWEVVNRSLGITKITSFAHSIGASSYNYANNTVTSNDLADTLTQLYGGKLLNANNITLLYSYMKNTNEESLIPAGIPEDVTVYHKYGALDTYQHDAAIIKGNNPFVLVVMTKIKNGATLKNSTSLIQEVAKISYQYMNGKP